ncbi:MAG TPA: hypothetical protein VHD63_25240 [Ktedonobacteraceae bacterium]|nr:hypothetical protein [Ktedonobacteraceae bacterium]
MPAEASFCGICGHAPGRTSAPATQIATRPALYDDDEHLPTTILPASAPAEEQQETAISNLNRQTALESLPTQTLPASGIPSPEQMEEEEEEEEKRRKAALAGLAAPGVLAAPGGASFVLPGTPPLGQIASVPGTPLVQPPFVAGTPAVPTPPSFYPAASATPQPGISTPGGGSHGGTGGTHGGTGSGTSGTGSPGSGTSGSPGSGTQTGCLMGALLAATALLVLLGSTAALGLTIWRPVLTLTGNAAVTPGSTLTLHGSSFLPNGNVELTLDDLTTPLFYLQRPLPAQLASVHTGYAANASQLFASLAQGKQAIAVQGSGSFTVSLLVDPAWKPGQHTIHANEHVTHRSASLTFTIVTASATATTTATPTPGSTTTPTPGLTATAAVPASLSCATPASLALGPLGEKSSHTASGSITLCTSGTGQLDWQANWNASWLSLSQQGGSLQAPASAQITITASAASLAAGTYQTAITFSSPQSASSQTVQVSLTVQAGCVNTTPTAMRFTGVAGVSNPAAQKLSVTNCGLLNNWSATVKTGASWLSLSQTHGTLAGGATGTIAVTASLLKAGLKAGTYSGTIAVTLGSQTRQTTVTLIVQSAPILSVSPTSINGYYCSVDASGANDVCTLTLANTSKSVSLNWSASASLTGVTVQASSHTIAPASRMVVTLLVPRTYENTKLTITFSGPGNAVTVDWSYAIVIP